MRGIRPTRRQKEFLSNKKFDSSNWLVVRDTSSYMDIVHKESKRVRRIPK